MDSMIKRLELELKANHRSEEHSRDTSSEDSSIEAEETKNKRVVLAVIGSRTMVDQQLFDETIEKWVKKYGEPDEIVSGGAVGADTMAEVYAREHDIQITVFRPDYATYPGKYAPIVRNTQIIEHCTNVLAFPSRSGSGTQDSLRKAKRFKRKVWVHWIN
jgi:YspA, cpYpsA-related SLOG family